MFQIVWKILVLIKKKQSCELSSEKIKEFCEQKFFGEKSVFLAKKSFFEVFFFLAKIKNVIFRSLMVRELKKKVEPSVIFH